MKQKAVQDTLSIVIMAREKISTQINNTSIMSRFNNIIKKNRVSTIYFFLVFLFFLLFYGVSHPPIITTSDDWHFMTSTRDAIPLASVHNPSRVMVEVFAPYAGMASVAILKPFGVDFVSSLAYGTAFLLACFIVIYTWNFYRLLNDRIHSGLRLTGQPAANRIEQSTKQHTRSLFFSS